MRVSISSSSVEGIDNVYMKESRKACEYLAANGWDLNWGSGSISIMGICYDEFCKYKRNIYGYTSEKYVDDIENLPEAQHVVFDTTFDLKKNIFNDADMVLLLPGGTGTISEFFAYLEEVRSNDVDRLLVLYNVNNHFASTIALINDLVARGFNSDSIFNYFKVANSFEEFKDIVDDFKKKEGNNLVKR